MDLELDDEQVALADSVRTVLARTWPATALRRLVEDGTGGDALWERVVHLDWPALCVPESDGGMGYGVVEASIVAEGCGRVAVPGPLLATTGWFAPVVRELGSESQRAELLGGVAAGTRTGTAALAELTASLPAGELDAGCLGVRATPDGDGWRLDGTARSVVDAATVDLIAIPARVVDEAGIGVFVVGRSDPGVGVIPVRALDASRGLAHVALDGVRVASDAVLGRPGDRATSVGLGRALDEAITVVAAELVGTCSTIFDLTLEHAKTREQFGVPIGSFQAVKHRLADAYLALEAARAAVLVAGAAIDEDDPRRRVAASTAKALAGDAAGILTREGIQLLGGLGFTWEHDMHLFVKRAVASSALLGTAETHRQRVAALIGLVAAP